jgi:small subunit ribosomal protein S14
MAKLSAIEKNKNRQVLVEKYAARRKKLKVMIKDNSISAEDKFEARFKLAELPRNSSRSRLRNRCLLSGRPRGNYRKFKLSRIALRDLASQGLIPGMTKASW